MFRGRLSDFESACRLNMTNRSGEGESDEVDAVNTAWSSPRPVDLPGDEVGALDIGYSCKVVPKYFPLASMKQPALQRC